MTLYWVEMPKGLSAEVGSAVAPQAATPIDGRDLERVQPGELSVVIGHVADSMADHSLKQVERFCLRCPGVPVLLLVHGQAIPVSRVLQLGRIGVLSVIDVEKRGWAEELRSSWSQVRGGLSTENWGAVGAMVPENAQTLFKAALRVAGARGSVPQLADRCGMSERGLRAFCTRNKLPPPRRVLSWARLLLVGELIDQGLHASVASQRLGFGCVGDMSALCKRYTGARLGELRVRGFLTSVSLVLCQELLGLEDSTQRTKVLRP